MAIGTPRFDLRLSNLGQTLLKIDALIVGAWGPRITGIVTATRTFAWHGGAALNALDEPVFIADGSIVCPNDATSYVQRDSLGVVTVSTVFNPLLIPMAKVVCAAGVLVRFEDMRDLALGRNIVSEGGGGGGNSVAPEAAPAVPSAYDDEFTSLSLDPKWSRVATDGGTGSAFSDGPGIHQRGWYTMRVLGTNSSPIPAGTGTPQIRLSQDLNGLLDVADGYCLELHVAIDGTGRFGSANLFISTDPNPDAAGAFSLVLGVVAVDTGFAAPRFNGYRVDNGTPTFSIVNDSLATPYKRDLYVGLQKNPASQVITFLASEDGIGWRHRLGFEMGNRSFRYAGIMINGSSTDRRAFLGHVRGFRFYNAARHTTEG